MKNSLLGVGLFSFLITTMLVGTQYADATGGGKELIDLINPMLDRALKAIQAGDTETALDELTTIQNELKDTYEVEE